VTKPKCIILLSEKSSGSSALQKLLTTYAAVKHVKYTRHAQQETLFWTNAASILGLPQIDMVKSQVPVSQIEARRDMRYLLESNLQIKSDSNYLKEDLFSFWSELCDKYQPVFFEKSPHNLCQWSALELILECIGRLKDIDFLVIGLVRNPMDTIYSQYRRWGARPERLEGQWVTAYSNLFSLEQYLGDKLVIVRYEDLVDTACTLKPVGDFLGGSFLKESEGFFHGKSISKWRNDRYYGFSLSDETAVLAKKYGYSTSDLQNSSSMMWPIYREIGLIKDSITRKPVKFIRLTKRKLIG